MTAPITQSARIAAELRARLAELYRLDEHDEAIDDTVAGEVDLPEQVALLAREAIRSEAFAKGLADLIKAEQARKARLEAKSERLRRLIAWAMSEAGFKKLSLPDMLLTLSAGRPELIVDNVSLAQVSPEFKRVSEAIDRTAIRDALAKGEQLDFARLGNSTPTLTIRKG